MKLNKEKAFVQVGGRLPLYYMQDGHGFNRKEEYLGEYDDQGDKIADAPADDENSLAALEAERLAAEEKARAEQEAAELAAKEKAEAEARAEADAAANNQPVADEKPAQDQAPETSNQSEAEADEPYKGVKSATMKKELETRGLDFEPDATREDLVALLVADDKAKLSA